MPGWPDEGRQIVQSPHLGALLERATLESRHFRHVFNAGAGEGGYSPLLLSLPGVEKLVESDYSYGSCRPRQIDPRQVFFASALQSIPIASHTFDLVLCTEVLEHVQEHEQALSELARVITPGGWLVITVPTPPAIPDRAHVREGYQPEELRQMLQRRGFEVVETRFCMHYFFRFVLGTWPRLPWRPRILIRSLSRLDTWIRLGPPMDLMLLARLPGKSLPAVPPAAEMIQSGAQRG
jgi:SAM-dependent methyltransferase